AARGAEPERGDRKADAGPRLRQAPAERVRAPAPPGEGSGHALRRLLRGAGGRRARPGEPGQEPSGYLRRVTSSAVPAVPQLEDSVIGGGAGDQVEPVRLGHVLEQPGALVTTFAVLR